MALEMVFVVGRVVSVDTFTQFSNGQVIPTLKVQSYLDGTFVDITWLPIGADQKMPQANQDVLYVTLGGRSPRIVSYWGTNAPHIRKGAFGLNEGEVVVQSDSGLGYLKLADDGSVELTTGDAITDLLLNDDGLQGTAPAFIFKGYAGNVVSINEDSTISLARMDSSGAVLSQVLMDADNNVSIQAPKGTFSILAKDILLDGAVKYGPGATDPEQAALFGRVVTSGPGGTYPFDFLTGIPIPGSSSVSAAG
jgi:hypothetical protein